MFFNFRDYTINLGQIVSIEWDDENACASVVMVDGGSYDIDDTDYTALKKAVGRTEAQ